MMMLKLPPGPRVGLAIAVAGIVGRCSAHRRQPISSGTNPGLPAVDADSSTRPMPSTGAAPGEPPPGLVAPPPELLRQLAALFEAVATALDDFGAAAVDDEGHVGSPTALHTLAPHLSETRRTVRETIRSARAAELTPATWLVVGSVLTDLRRMLAELEGSRDMSVTVPAYRPRRIPPRNPTILRSFRPRRKTKSDS